MRLYTHHRHAPTDMNMCIKNNSDSDQNYPSTNKNAPPTHTLTQHVHNNAVTRPTHKLQSTLLHTDRCYFDFVERRAPRFRLLTPDVEVDDTVVLVVEGCHKTLAAVAAPILAIKHIHVRFEIVSGTEQFSVGNLDHLLSRSCTKHIKGVHLIS